MKKGLRILLLAGLLLLISCATYKGQRVIDSRQVEMQSDLKEARTELKIANQKLEEANSKLDSLQDELKEFRADLEKDLDKQFQIIKDKINETAKSEDLDQAVARINEKIKSGMVEITGTVVNCDYLWKRTQPEIKEETQKDLLQKGGVIKIKSLVRGWALLEDDTYVSTFYLSIEHRYQYQD